MKLNLLMAIILPVISYCNWSPAHPPVNPQQSNWLRTDQIPLPAGYTRVSLDSGSFGAWLRRFPLKTTKTVYLFDGRVKPNQSAQYAVLDLSTGKEDLQQCADAIMRLRAEWLYEQKRYNEIWFSDNNSKKYKAPHTGDRKQFDNYLRTVFAWCGTLSLEKQLRPVSDINAIKPGDVLIKGGSPGHAAIVMDVAANQKGDRIYLLANSYMPAQDTHIVLNPENRDSGPWFRTNDGPEIRLPEWTFTIKHLRTW